MSTDNNEFRPRAPWETFPGSGWPRAGTPDDAERVKRSPPSDHDLKMHALVSRLNYREDALTPGTVRYAYRQWKNTTGLFLRALGRWFYVLPCRFYWHASFPQVDATSLKICRRCGAWREHDWRSE